MVLTRHRRRHRQQRFQRRRPLRREPQAQAVRFQGQRVTGRSRSAPRPAAPTAPRRWSWTPVLRAPAEAGAAALAARVQRDAPGEPGALEVPGDPPPALANAGDVDPAAERGATVQWERLSQQCVGLRDALERVVDRPSPNRPAVLRSGRGRARAGARASPRARRCACTAGAHPQRGPDVGDERLARRRTSRRPRTWSTGPRRRRCRPPRGSRRRRPKATPACNGRMVLQQGALADGRHERHATVPAITNGTTAPENCWPTETVAANHARAPAWQREPGDHERAAAEPFGVDAGQRRDDQRRPGPGHHPDRPACSGRVAHDELQHLREQDEAERPRHERDPVGRRERARAGSADCSIGARRSSQAMKATSNAAPPASAATIGCPKPSPWPRIRPKTTPNRPGRPRGRHRAGPGRGWIPSAGARPPG